MHRGLNRPHGRFPARSRGVPGRPRGHGRCRLVSGLLCLALAAAGPALAQSATDPFTCSDGHFYQIRGGGGGSILSIVNRDVVPYTLDELHTVTPLMNALGYNPVDDYLYAIGSDGRQLYRLARGAAINLNPATPGNGAAIAGFPTTSTIDSGTFDLHGNFLAALQDGRIYRITGITGTPPVSPVATLIPRQADSLAPGGYVGTTALFVGDWAFNPVESTSGESVLYGLRSLQGGTIYLYRARIVNPSAAEPVAYVSRIATTGLTTNNAFGTVFIDSSGALYAYRNDASATGGFFSVDLATGAGTTVSGSQSTNQSDGANCPLAPASIPPVLALNKVTTNGAGGPFEFALTNTGQATGSVTTTEENVPVQVDGDAENDGDQPFTVSAFNTPVTIRESALPNGWSLSDAACTSGGVAVGSLSGDTYTIPAAAVVSGAEFVCTFSNTATYADVGIAKSVTPDEVASGEEVTYSLIVTNAGPSAADGTVLRDPPVAGLDCSAATPTCSADGGASCPAGGVDIDLLQDTGVIIDDLPAGGEVTVTLSCQVTASGVP